MSSLADRVRVLRDEVLDIAESGEDSGCGSEVFDAVVQELSTMGETIPGLDLSLHEAISRRLAWGESETAILGGAQAVFRRLVTAAQRSFRDPRDEIILVKVATDVACSAAKLVALGSMTKTNRERAARLREEMAQRRLVQALERQREARRQLETQLRELNQ